VADPATNSAIAEALAATGSAHHEYEQIALKGLCDELWAGLSAAFLLRSCVILLPEPNGDTRRPLSRGRFAGDDAFDEAEFESLCLLDVEPGGSGLVQWPAQEMFAGERHGENLQEALDRANHA
jgi:hypothetical protein